MKGTNASEPSDEPQPDRKVLVAELRSLGQLDPDLAEEFARDQAGEWLPEGSLVSFVRVLNLDENGDPLGICDSIAPSNLVSAEELAECDDSRIFRRCARRHGRAGRAYRVHETVGFVEPADSDAATLDLDSDERTWHIRRRFFSVTEETLLVQDVTLRPEVVLGFDRNLLWEDAFHPDLPPFQPWTDEESDGAGW